MRGKTMNTVDDLSKQILADVATDFRARNLGTSALREGYIGPAIAELELKYCADGRYSKVDFDLALKQLEESKSVKTGPMEVYDNPPDSHVMVIGIFSKRKFVYLTEKGYRAAQKSAATRPSTKLAENIHFHGDNARFNVNSSDNSTNIASVTNEQLFVQMQEAARSIKDENERNEIGCRLHQLEKARGTGGFLQAYQNFMASAANHMTVFAPFLPMLAQMLTR
ncbi:MAG: hypothetical protein DMG36_00555 [Acidobacteria bacterium]|nr:MAG: hypothetical protein DMG36_00555 [Acidobacteriota bacterium]